MLLLSDAVSGDEDSHWLSRARYHFRMEEYWRDRALIAERALLKLQDELEYFRRSQDE